MSRPQIGIDRLPVRRMSNEPKEAMNCKSCRKRKIKCNRLRPSCEACQVFQCPCIYDAIPKKRGPKTDVLEALVKRVHQMEKALEANGKPIPAPEESGDTDEEPVQREVEPPTKPPKPILQRAPSSVDATNGNGEHHHLHQETPQQRQPSVNFGEQALRTHATAPRNTALLDVYFESLHNKPYYILDEAATRQRWISGQLPLTVVSAIHAVTARYAPHLMGGYNAAVRISEETAIRARNALDIDDPSIENIQVALLLSLAYFQAGRGKKSYMLMSSAISMAFAQNLHRELPAGPRISPNEREGRRRLFWTCYILDRFVACGSKRPCLVGDDSISLRLPAWYSDPSAAPYEGNYFTNGTNVPMVAGPGRASQSSASMLIEISRVLGITNRYLAAGGVKGDSHFPWHAQSNLSRIRQDLDTWAANAQDAFASIDALFGQPESSTLVLSKLIYHLVHCLIYRPFLPVDLTELAGTGQHQSWQMEATNLCFLHANAIAELVEIGRASSLTDWPAFVGYCLCTAGTVHVHGALYTGRDGDVFARSSEFLSREMSQLSEMRVTWAGVQHQRETLQTVYGCHSQLVKSLSSNPLRFSPVFQMEDFFDRYPGQYIDGAHVTFADIVIEALHESIPAYNNVLNNSAWQWNGHSHSQASTTAPMMHATIPSPIITPDNKQANDNRKRRRTNDASSASPHRPLPPISDPALNPPLSPRANHPFESPQQSFLTLAPQQDQNGDNHGFGQNPLSPSFSFSPWAAQISLAPGMLDTGQGQHQLDSFFSLPQSIDQLTPGGISASGSTHTEGDKDPFMSLLEQLAENEHAGGPSDLDFYLGAQN